MNIKIINNKNLTFLYTYNKNFINYINLIV